jgi:hypothetical protein
MIAGMFSASRGPALRFASSSPAGGFDDRGAVRVEWMPPTTDRWTASRSR